MIKHPAATLLDELPDEVMLHAFRDLQVLPTPSGHSPPSPTWGVTNRRVLLGRLKTPSTYCAHCTVCEPDVFFLMCEFCGP